MPKCGWIIHNDQEVTDPSCLPEAMCDTQVYHQGEEVQVGCATDLYQGAIVRGVSYLVGAAAFVYGSL